MLFSNRSFLAAAASLLLLAYDGRQPASGQDGRVVKDGRELQDDRRVLSPPRLDEPIYACTEGVWVSGFIPGAQIDIFIAGIPTPVGTGTSQFATGDKFKVSVTWEKGMVVTATQTWNGVTSNPSNAVTVRHPKDDYPTGYPKPRIDPPPVLRCGRAIGARDLLNGSRMEVLQEKRRLDGTFEPEVTVGSVDNAQPWDYAITSPFEQDARVRVKYRICDEDSPLSDFETVQPQPSIPLPIIDPGYENQEIVVVRNTVNGANLEVFANAVAPANRVGGQPTAVSWGQQILVNPPAAPGVPLLPTQALCDPPVVGPPMTPKPCSELPPAKIKRPAPGDDYVEVTESVPGATIRIYVGSSEIGHGGGSPITLIRAVQEGEVVRVVQSLDDRCTSQWVFEIPVGCSRSDDANACRADWPAFGHDSTRAAQQPKLSALADPFRVRTLKVKWRFPRTGTLQLFRSSPIVYKGIVYVGNADGRFYAIDAATGNQIWQYPPSGQPPLTSRYADPGVGRVNDSSRGLASSGVIARIRGEVDAVFFGGPDRSIPPGFGSGRLFAIHAQTGAEIWKSDAVAVLNGTTVHSLSELHEQIGYSSPVVINDRVYIGIADHADSPIQNGKVVAVDLNSGSIVGGFSFLATSDRGGGVWSAPAGGPNGELYITTGNTNIGQPPPAVNHGLSLLRLNPSTGSVIWELQPVPFALDEDPDWASGPQSAKTSCGSVVASTQKDGWSYAVNAGGAAPAPANVIWQFPPTGFPFTRRPPIHGDTRYLVPGAIWEDVFVTMTGGVRIATTTLDGFNKLHGLDICGNKQDPIRWLLDVPDTTPDAAYQLGPPTGTRGIFFVGTEQGRLIVFADHTVVPHAGLRCTNPGLMSTNCVARGGRLVPQPWVIANIPLNAGGIRTQPALADGRVFVATLGGVLFMLEP
jgi:outer membrane protein assembly factor BamB